MLLKSFGVSNLLCDKVWGCKFHLEGYSMFISNHHQLFYQILPNDVVAFS